MSDAGVLVAAAGAVGGYAVVSGLFCVLDWETLGLFPSSGGLDVFLLLSVLCLVLSTVPIAGGAVYGYASIFFSGAATLLKVGRHVRRRCFSAEDCGGNNINSGV